MLQQPRLFIRPTISTPKNSSVNRLLAVVEIEVVKVQRALPLFFHAALLVTILYSVEIRELDYILCIR